MTGCRRSIFPALVAVLVVSLVTVRGAVAQKSPDPSGWVGLSVTQSSRGKSGAAAKLEYPVVASVDPGSPAQAAGLIAGDTILAYNDVDARSDPLAVRRFLKAGEDLVIKVRRNTVRNLTLTVAKRTAQNAYSEGVTVRSAGGASLPTLYSAGSGLIALAAPVAAGREAVPFAGAYLARLNAGLASALNVRDSGVLVVDVGEGSAAAKSGLESGDVITSADTISVMSPLEIMTALHLASGRSMTLEVSRRGKMQKITIRW